MMPAVDNNTSTSAPADKPWETLEAEVLDALSAARLAPGDVATALAMRASLYKGKTYQPPCIIDTTWLQQQQHHQKTQRVFCLTLV